jgi:hypothetical protein
VCQSHKPFGEDKTKQKVTKETKILKLSKTNKNIKIKFKKEEMRLQCE